MKVKLRLGEHICPVCGKIFYIEDVSKWAYKYKKRTSVKLSCTWSCLLKLKATEKPKGVYNDLTRRKKPKRKQGA